MADNAPVTKAVVPAAGLGTRFLPATKATPKEMLPSSTSRRSSTSSRRPSPPASTTSSWSPAAASGPSRTTSTAPTSWRRRCAPRATPNASPPCASPATSPIVHYVRQGDPKGLGHAVHCAAPHVGRRAVRGAARRRPDRRARPAAAAHDRGAERYGGSVVALMEVAPEQVSLYGCAAIEADRRGRRRPGHRPGREARRRARRPATGSSSAATSATPPSSTSWRRPRRAAAARSSSPTRCARSPTAEPTEGGPVHGVVFRGRRYDTGNKLDYLRTVVQFAGERPDLAPEFLPWLREFVARR